MTDWIGKKLCAEAEARLNNVFGEQFRFKHDVEAIHYGLRRALTARLADDELGKIWRQAQVVGELIGEALRKGIGDWPAGWSFLPFDAAQHQLIVWVNDDRDIETIAKEAK